MAISVRSVPCMRLTITYSCHAEVSENTSSLCAHDTAVLDLCRAGVAVHLTELELRLRARALREGGITDDIAKGLSVTSRLSACVYCGSPMQRHYDVRRAKETYLSGSCCSKTLRLVWSRMFMMLTKQPRSSFLGLNWAMVAL